MNRNKVAEFIIIYAIMMTVFTSCAPAPMANGMVEAIQPGTVAWVVSECDRAILPHILLQNGSQNVLAVWNQSAQAWFSVFLNSDEKNVFDVLMLLCGGKGNCMSRATMADYVTGLMKDPNWKPVDTVPPAILAALKDARSWMRVMPNLPVMIIPAGVMDIPAQILPKNGEIE